MDFRVGTWLVQPGFCRLVSDGRASHLTPKSMDVLVCLARGQGKVVSKQEIRDAVWPDTYVSDDALTRCLVELRHAFQDDARQPAIIETIAKRGYRVIPPVTWEEIEAPPHVAGRRRQWLTASAAVVLAAAGLMLWRLNRPGSATPPAIMPIPLTSYPGVEMSPSFSPEGDRVAFSWNGPQQDNFDIYVRLIDADSPVRLTNDPAPDLGPAWSPDGRWIAFRRILTDERSGVFLIPAVGGTERKLTEVSWGVGFRDGRSMVSWHPGSRWLVVPDRDSNQEPLGLFLVSAETGEKRRLTSAPGGHPNGDGDPAVSPDGRAVVFTRPDGGAGGRELYLLELSEQLRGVGAPRRLTSMQGDVLDPAWWPDGNSILFVSGAPDNKRKLWRMAMRGAGRQPGEPVPLLLGGAVNYVTPAVSRQGRVAYAQRGSATHIRRLALDGSKRTADMPMSSTRLDYLPAYSADGRRIAFISNRSGSYEVWKCDADGSHTVRLTSLGGPRPGNVAWSPDGRRLAFGVRSGQTYEIQTVSADGGKLERLSGGSSKEGISSWSRDGKWIYFDSDRGGRTQVWKVPAAGGEPVQVTKQGGIGAFESSDGRFVYYLLAMHSGGSNTELWRIPAQGGEEVRVIDSVCPQMYAVAESGIYFFSSWTNPMVKRFNFTTRRVETVAKVEGRIGWGLTVSSDGRRLLYAALSDQSDLMMLEKLQ